MSINKTVKPITPKQAAMLLEMLYRREGEFMRAVCLQQEWDLWPYLYINDGGEFPENLNQAAEFLEEWATKFREYAITCPKRKDWKQIQEEDKPKKSKKKQLTLDDQLKEQAVIDETVWDDNGR